MNIYLVVWLLCFIFNIIYWSKKISSFFVNKKKIAALNHTNKWKELLLEKQLEHWIKIYFISVPDRKKEALNNIENIKKEWLLLEK